MVVGDHIFVVDLNTSGHVVDRIVAVLIVRVRVVCQVLVGLFAAFCGIELCSGMHVRGRRGARSHRLAPRSLGLNSRVYLQTIQDPLWDQVMALVGRHVEHCSFAELRDIEARCMSMEHLVSCRAIVICRVMHGERGGGVLV